MKIIIEGELGDHIKDAAKMASVLTTIDENVSVTIKFMDYDLIIGQNSTIESIVYDYHKRIFHFDRLPPEEVEDLVRRINMNK